MKALATFVALLALSSAVIAAKKVPWVWSNDVPVELITTVPAKNRDPATYRGYFRSQDPAAITIRSLLAYFGKPDGFSPQFFEEPIGKARDRAGQSGTIRFVLSDGTDLCVWTPNRHSIATALRYLKGGSAELIYK